MTDEDYHSGETYVPDKVLIRCMFPGEEHVVISLNYDNITAAEIAAMIRAAFVAARGTATTPDMDTTFINRSADFNTNSPKPWWGQ